MTEQHKLDLIKAFMNAWEDADAGRVLALMDSNSSYSASVGPEPGTTYTGWDALERGVSQMLAFEAGGESRQGRVWLCDDRGFAEWSYDALNEDGSVSEIRGIDVIKIGDEKILSIDAYRKCHGPAPDDTPA